MDVDYFFDPVCTWSWVTSRWLVEVAPHRDLRVRWRVFSTLLAQTITGVQDPQVTACTASHRALRVVEAVRDEHPDAVERLYKELMRHSMTERVAGRPLFSDLAAVLEHARLDPAYARAAHDERMDRRIQRSMGEAYAVVGEGAQAPVTIVWGEHPVGFHGPILSPAPKGEAALELWDALMTLTRVPGFYELSRPRPAGPELPQFSGNGRQATHGKAHGSVPE